MIGCADSISLELSNQRSLVQARVAQPRSRGLLPRQRRAARATVPEPDSADARPAAGLQHRAFGHLLAADQVGERLDERLNQRRHAVQMRAVRIRGVTVRVVTNYGGSCNGAKIRFSPQKDWAVNASVAKTISALDPVKESHPTLSTAHDVDDDVAHCACSTRAVPESPHCRHPQTWTEVSEKVYKADGGHDGHEYDSPELTAAVQLLASEESVFKHVAKPTTSTRAAKLRDARTF
ncbi:hypothetical protein PF007_g23652 [Phytophthora fragariae]|uniref:Uncharacterized protein n=1 Tax=Phytophthora fragariae TaxID=53985 RepID=A0A6A3QLJ4_9STRA|nr:hypothetical protein PF007_g23652 [Phytophthora fragariae]